MIINNSVRKSDILSRREYLFSDPKFRTPETMSRFIKSTTLAILGKLGFQLMKIRYEKEIPQKVLAKSIQTSVSQISRIERGKQNISIAYLIKLAIALDIPIRISLVTGLQPVQIDIPDPAVW